MSTTFYPILSSLIYYNLSNARLINRSSFPLKISGSEANWIPPHPEHYRPIRVESLPISTITSSLRRGSHSFLRRSLGFTVGGGWRGRVEGRFTIHKTTRWIELSERCGSCQSVPGSVRAPTARICIIPFMSTILIGGLFQSLSPRIFALLLLSFLHTPLPSHAPPSLLFVRLFLSNSFDDASFFLSLFLSELTPLDFTYPCAHLYSFFVFLFLLTRTTLVRLVHHPFSWLMMVGLYILNIFLFFFFDSCS